MFSLQICLIFWISSSVIMLGRGVKCFFRMNFFDEGNHDSVSRNSRGFSNLQENNHDDKQNHMIPSTYPVSMGYLNQLAEENNKRQAVDIATLKDWDNHFNHPESVIQQELYQGSALPHSVYMSHKNLINQHLNCQSALKFHLEYPWNFTPGDSSFSDPNLQKETQPHVDSTKYQASSSNAIQPMCDGDLHCGNIVSLLPQFDEFRYPDSSFVPQEHHNLKISHEQNTENPAFHSMQKDLSSSLHLSEMRNRVYQNQDWGALSLNPASSSENSGFMNTDKHIENIVTLKKHEGKKAKSGFKAERKDIKERNELIKILKDDFSVCSKETIQYFSTENIHCYISFRESKNLRRRKLSIKKLLIKISKNL
ncbi:hypothetical protein PPACK8108_LOCUS2375 [Phakopsora pachyrhizi]|uniref:Uncharacterized protein n=1 Tax=Phakopsora pachyrhizi TaxID=170000 RepID=A0AAV0AIY0_PHAPC|nr:hypothetical protein PPACK8108_LOCUS2375 [Phakopsora pachyrhizi]